MAQLAFLSLLLTSLWLSFYQIIVGGLNVGELSGFPLQMGDIELYFLVFINSFIFVLFYGFNALLARKKLTFSKKINFRLVKVRLDVVFLVILVVQLLFLIFTGVGRLLSEATHPLSPLFSLLTPDAFFSVYYLLSRVKVKGKSNRLFIINVTLFSALKLLQGWSSFFLVILFLEFFHRTRFIRLTKKNIVISLLFPLFVLFFGGAVYQYVFQFKNNIRGVTVPELTYFEGVSHLASRLSMAPISVGAYDRVEDVVNAFKKDGYQMKEIQGLGRPLLPKVIMADKDFRPLGNNILEVYYPEITKYTSSNMGIYMYSLILILSDAKQAILFLCISVFLVFLSKIFLDSIEEYKGQLQFVLFMILINLADIASLEVVFGYGFIKVIPVFIVCWILGAFKVSILNKAT